jgi:hypothetical protein
VLRSGNLRYDCSNRMASIVSRSFLQGLHRRTKSRCGSITASAFSTSNESEKPKRSFLQGSLSDNELKAEEDKVNQWLSSTEQSLRARTSSFFSQTSVRSQRKAVRRRQLKNLKMIRQDIVKRRNKKVEGDDDDDGAEEYTDYWIENNIKDTRTIRDILLPTPYYGENVLPIDNGDKLPRDWRLWLESFREAVVLYKSTFDGFFSSSNDDKEGEEQVDWDKVKNKAKMSAENAKENIEYVKGQGMKLKAAFHNKTGVDLTNTEQLKAIAAVAMKLATLCVREFMSGYRNGRDSEVEVRSFTSYSITGSCYG